ncbi:MAG: mechanosensitive ion channel domain-containing protein, partial [Mangrovicoccus sp.]
MTIYRRLGAILLLLGLLVGGVGHAQDASQPANPELGALLEVLKDPQARDQLISALSSVEDPAASDAAGADSAAEEPSGGSQSSTPSLTALMTGTATSSESGSDPPSADETAADLPARASTQLTQLAQKTAEATAEFSDVLQDRLVNLRADLERLSRLPDYITETRLARIQSEALPLLATIISTVIAYRVLRSVTTTWLPSPQSKTSMGERAGLVIAQVVLRAMSIGFAWVLGYILAYFIFGRGEIAVPQALYLNAFLARGAFTLVLSLFLSKDPKEMTFTRLPQDIEATTYMALKRVAGFLIFGVIMVVPLSRIWTNFVIAGSVQTLVVTIGAILSIIAIRKIRRAIDAWQAEQQALAQARADSDEDEDNLNDYVAAKTLGLWNKFWPPLAMLYVLVCYFIALSNPSLMVSYVGRATGATVIAVALMFVAVRIFGHASDLKLPLPGIIDRNFPGFRTRIQGVVPAFAFLLGMATLAAAVGFVLEGWRVVDMQAWLSSEMVSASMWRITSAIVIFGLVLVFWAATSSYIDSRLVSDLPGRNVSARTRTLLSLFRNAFTIAVIVFGGMMALSELGINIAPLLAGAGVIGLAIGFGAQKLVQDIITGVFIQLENAINEGDVITVAGLTGSVESLTIRSVGIRDLAGVYHLIPFSAVDTVSNFMRKFGCHVEVVGVAYDADLAVAREALFAAFDEVKASDHGWKILEPLEYHGVVGLADSSVNLRVRLKTRPGDQWAVGRAYTEAVKRALDERGVEIPFP